MKLPYGISNFQYLIENNYYYADKTKYIETLEDFNAPYLFFLRPRRFGKSLFVSMLSYYYDLKSKNRFDDLFGQFHIGQQPTPHANGYMILMFEFSRINTETKEATLNSFRMNVLTALEVFCRTYQLDFTGLAEIQEPVDMMKVFFTRFKLSNTDKTIYLLIDEYDHFANELLSYHPREFSEIVSKTGFVRKFYESLKTATSEGIISRIFATGVTPITLDSMTSGFNIGRNISTLEIVNEMMGFTEQDVTYLLTEMCNNTDQNLDLIYHDLAKYYNGYRFNVDASHRIFNPDMILYFMSDHRRGNQLNYPQELIDTNIASDYSKIAHLFQVGDYNENLNILHQLITEKEVRAQLTDQFSLQKGFDENDFISLLFYMGIATLKKRILSRFIFTIPNYVIETLYLRYFANIIAERHQINFDSNQIEDALFEMAMNNNLDKFIKIIEFVLRELSFRDYQKFDEKYIKVIITAFLSLSNLYFVKSEYELNEGYVDLLLLNKPPIIPNYQFAIELKYLKKSDTAQLSKLKETALQQLRNYLNSDEVQRMSTLQGYVLIFAGEKCQLCENVVI